MNQISKCDKKIIQKSKRKFPKLELLRVHVKANASVPYDKSFFHKIIADSKNPKLKHKKYNLYIHKGYLTISSCEFLFEPVRVKLHDELWIELYSVFNLDKK